MFTKIRPCGHFRKGADGKDKLLCLLYRHLDDGEPFGRVLLVPDTVDVNGARSTDNLVALLLQIGEELDIVVIEFLIRAEDLQTGSQRHGRDVLELDQSRVCSLLCHLLAVLDVDVLRLVAAVLDGLAVARFRAFAAQTGHFRANHLVAKATEVFKGRDDGTMAGHRDGRK